MVILAALIDKIVFNFEGEGDEDGGGEEEEKEDADEEDEVEEVEGDCLWLLLINTFDKMLFDDLNFLEIFVLNFGFLIRYELIFSLREERFEDLGECVDEGVRVDSVGVWLRD